VAQYLSLRPAFFARGRLRYHGLSEGPETFAQRLRKRTMDVLSEILKVVKLKGALFYKPLQRWRGARDCLSPAH
jgi:hypothetical protein